MRMRILWSFYRSMNSKKVRFYSFSTGIPYFTDLAEGINIEEAEEHLRLTGLRHKYFVSEDLDLPANKKVRSPSQKRGLIKTAEVKRLRITQETAFFLMDSRNSGPASPREDPLMLPTSAKILLLPAIKLGREFVMKKMMDTIKMLGRSLKPKADSDMPPVPI